MDTPPALAGADCMLRRTTACLAEHNSGKNIRCGGGCRRVEDSNACEGAKSMGGRRIMLHCFHTPRLPPPAAHLQRQRHLAAALVAGAQSAAQPRPAPLPSGLQCLLCATSLFKQSLKFMRSTSRIWVHAGGGWGRGAPKMLSLLPLRGVPNQQQDCVCRPRGALRLPPNVHSTFSPGGCTAQACRILSRLTA